MSCPSLRNPLAPFLLAALLGVSLCSGEAKALRANTVAYEFHPGFHRVVIVYTLPALKEWREAHVDFTNAAEAATFYWQIVRGGEFFLGDPKRVVYPPPPSRPEPW